MKVIPYDKTRYKIQLLYFLQQLNQQPNESM